MRRTELSHANTPSNQDGAPFSRPSSANLVTHILNHDFRPNLLQQSDFQADERFDQLLVRNSSPT